MGDNERATKHQKGNGTGGENYDQGKNQGEKTNEGQEMASPCGMVPGIKAVRQAIKTRSAVEAVRESPYVGHYGTVTQLLYGGETRESMQ